MVHALFNSAEVHGDNDWWAIMGGVGSVILGGLAAFFELASKTLPATSFFVAAAICIVLATYRAWHTADQRAMKAEATIEAIRKRFACRARLAMLADDGDQLAAYLDAAKTSSSLSPTLRERKDRCDAWRRAVIAAIGEIDQAAIDGITGIGPFKVGKLEDQVQTILRRLRVVIETHASKT